jgi:hypothetical protein
LLRFCGAFPCGIFYARAAGYCNVFGALDAATREAFESFLFETSDAVWDEVCAPPRFGGLGLLRLSSVAPLAVAACTASSAHLASRLCPAAPSSDSCSILRCALSSPVFALFPLLAGLVEQALREPKPARGLQRTLCDAPGREAFSQRTVVTEPRVTARRLSCSAPGVAAIFAPTPGVDDDLWHRLPVLWFPPALFIAALRLHLGLSVLPASGRCPFCRCLHADLATHAVDCHRGGGRQRTHTAIKQAVFSAAASAQWAPRLETTPFVDSTGRIDVDCFWCGENLLGDTAVVSHGPHLSAAAREPGGAATAYEHTKREKYGAAAARTNPNMTVMPLVWDTFGAAGSSAEKFVSRAGLAAANRFGLHHSRVIGLLRERLAARVVHGIAAIVVEASWRIDAETDLPTQSRPAPRARPKKHAAQKRPQSPPDEQQHHKQQQKQADARFAPRNDELFADVPPSDDNSEDGRGVSE